MPLRIMRMRIKAGMQPPTNFATVVTDLTTCHNTWFHEGVDRCEHGWIHSVTPLLQACTKGHYCSSSSSQPRHAAPVAYRLAPDHQPCTRQVLRGHGGEPAAGAGPGAGTRPAAHVWPAHPARLRPHIPIQVQAAQVRVVVAGVWVGGGGDMGGWG